MCVTSSTRCQNFNENSKSVRVNTAEERTDTPTPDKKSVKRPRIENSSCTRQCVEERTSIQKDFPGRMRKNHKMDLQLWY